MTGEYRSRQEHSAMRSPRNISSCKVSRSMRGLYLYVTLHMFLTQVFVFLLKEKYLKKEKGKQYKEREREREF